MNKHYPVMKSMNVLNMLLLLAVTGAAYAVVVPFFTLNIPRALPVAGKAETTAAEPPASLPTPYPADYLMIGEQNLFHPERKIPTEKKEKVALPKPDLVLYGTLITDNLSIAYIEDRKSPYSTPGRGKRQTQLKKGESVGGYVLQEVEARRIVLARGEEKMVVSLDDSGKRNAAGATYSPPSAGAPLNSAASGTPAARSSALATPSAAARATTGLPAPAASPGIAPATNLQASSAASLTRRQRVQLLQQEKQSLRLPVPTALPPAMGAVLR